MKELRQSAAWMWSHRGENIWWTPAALTEDNPDENAPRLTLVEAASVFKVLEEEGLVYPVQHPNTGATAYLVNEVKEREWATFLRDSSGLHMYLLRPLGRVFGSLWNAVIWFISVVIAALVVGIIQKALE